MSEPKDPSRPGARPAASPALAATPSAAGTSQSLQELVAEFERLPGIGRRTAERLAYHVLRAPAEEALRLARAISEVKRNVRHCKVCFNITEGDVCAICEDPGRDPSTICVVEQPKDLWAIEGSGSYRGRYHVLLGAFAPLEGVTPSDLTIDALLSRLTEGGVTEVILATNPNFEGDGTALFLKEKLKAFPAVRITRIARGIPSGSHIEHAARNIVSDALEGRREMQE
jgi:recombination protein RecR